MCKITFSQVKNRLHKKSNHCNIPRFLRICESSSGGRAPRCQRGCRGSESRLSLNEIPAVMWGFLYGVINDMLRVC